MSHKKSPVTPSKDFMKGYLSGIFDGEGGVYSYRRKNRHGTKTWHSHRLAFCNTDKEIIDRSVKYLQELGFYPHILIKKPHNPHHLLVYEVDLRSKDMVNAKEVINFASQRKTKRLKEIVDYLLTRPRFYVDLEGWKEKRKAGKSYQEIALESGFKKGESIRSYLNGKYGHKRK